MYAGSLKYETKLDTSGFQKGVDQMTDTAGSGGTKLKNIVAGLGITKLISKAISTITNSMDGAIARIDALNNFPKVMSNLGISSEESTKSINKLSEKLKGIPTKLDDAALAVQRFTSANGDVEKSTDIFLAVNNAILAGGASMEIQSSALEQLSQAYSKGKPDMMEWRSLQQAMPAQLKQISTAMLSNKESLEKYMNKAQEYADANPLSSTAQELVEQLEAVKKGTGDMSTALGTGLRSGIISMDDFIDMIIKMNKEGVKGFKTLEEQAKNATGGIATNVTNMKTAITRGVGNIISSFDKMLQKANLGTLADNISKFGKTSEKVLNNVGKAIANLNLKELLKVLKALSPVIIGLATAFITFKTALAVKDLIAGLAQSIVGLNSVMKDNPVLAVTTALIGLIAVIDTVVKKTNATDQELKNLQTTLDGYNEKTEQLRQTQEKQISSGMSELAYYQDLANELYEITDANGKVQDGYETRANFIITTLNEALGTEIKMTNGIIENYQGIKKSIEAVIEAKEAEILINAHEEEYQQAIQSKSEKFNTLTEAIQKNQEKVDELSKSQNKLAKYMGVSNTELTEFNFQMGNRNWKKAEEELNRLGFSFSTIEDVTGLTASEYSKLVQSVDDSYIVLSEARSAWEENQIVIDNNRKATEAFQKGNYSALEQIYNTTVEFNNLTDEENKASHERTLQSYQKYYSDLLDGNTKLSGDLLTNEKQRIYELMLEEENFISQYTSANERGLETVKEDWAKNNANILSDLTGKNVEYREVGKNQVQMYANGVAIGEPVSTKEAKKTAEKNLNEFKKLKQQLRDAGIDNIQGYINGNNYKAADLNKAMGGIAKRALKTFKQVLGINSPSKEMMKLGDYSMKGYEIGLQKEQANLYSVLDNISDEMLERTKNAVNIETGKMSFSGTSGSVTQMLNANAKFEGTIPMTIDLDGEVIYKNQQVISARKNLQYGGGK